jgi:hypothetical protein
MKLAGQFFVITLFCFSTIHIAASDARATNDLSSIPPAAQSSISAALGRDLPDYHVRTTRNGLEAANSHGALTTRFTSAGVQLTTGTLRWAMTLRGYGYGDSIKSVAKASPQANANRVEYRRGPLTEWYENGPVGLEQGFTLIEPPGKRDGKTLMISLGLSGDLTAISDISRTGLTLVDRSGNTVLRYAGLTARDADGNDLHASLEVRGDALLIHIEDGKGCYPLVIDPLVQLAELTASDGVQSDSLGWSVGSSGNTIVAGGDGGISYGAPAHVFVKPATGWANMTETAELSPSDGVTFGRSVAISGNTIVVGAMNATVGSNTFQGKVFVYVEPAGGWTNMTETAQLTASDGEQGSEFGYSVAISGNTVVAGAELDSDNNGAVYVFTKPATGWATMTQTAKLTASEDPSGAFLGYSVAISGNTVVSGAIFSGSNFGGAAYVFVKPSTGWVSATENARLTSSDTHYDDEFGASVAIDGDTLVVGALEPDNPHRYGAAYVFAEPVTGWASSTENAELRTSDGAVGDYFGWSVSISGNRIAVGAPEATIGANQYQGAAYLYSEPTAGWRNTSHFSQKLTAGDWGAGVGSAVVLGGNALVAGASGVGGNVGAVYVFGP